MDAVQSASKFNLSCPSILFHRFKAVDIVRMLSSTARFLAALLCIFVRFSRAASPSDDISVSQPPESDASGADAYDSANLHNASNQISSNQSILVHGSILNQTDFDNPSSSQAVK